MTSPAVLLDACTLVPIRLTSCLLSLAEAGLLTPLWSDEILDEVERNLPKLKGMTVDKAKRRVDAMRAAFDDEASVGDYQSLVPQLECDPKDRHVLAAAIIGGADVLLTFNVKDFPAESTQPYGVSVKHPDEFLTVLLAERREEVLATVRSDAATYREPPTTMTEYLAALTGVVPVFANLANSALGVESADEAPFAALVEADEVEALAAMGRPGDLSDPAQVALLWWGALMAGSPEVQDLTYDPSAWGDYQWALDVLQGRSLASGVIALVDAPNDVAIMRFIPQVASTARTFAAFITEVTFLTLVRVGDNTWRVWGLGPGILCARDILASDIA